MDGQVVTLLTTARDRDHASPHGPVLLLTYVLLSESVIATRQLASSAMNARTRCSSSEQSGWLTCTLNSPVQAATLSVQPMILRDLRPAPLARLGARTNRQNVHLDPRETRAGV